MRNKQIFAIATAILINLNLFSVNKDSLLKVISSPNVHDTSKYYAYFELGWEYIYSNPDTSIIFAKKAYTLVKKFPTKRNQSKILNLFGACFQMKGDFFQAIEYYQKSLKIGEELKDSDIMLISYGNIGALYVSLDDNEKAKEFLLKSLEIAQKKNKNDQLGGIYNNLCVVELNLKHFEKCIEYGNKSIDYNKLTDDKNSICSAMGNIGNAFGGLNNYNKALEYYNQCYKTAIEINNIYEQARSLHDIGRALTKLKKNEEALEYLLKAYNMAEKNQILNILEESSKDLYYEYKKRADVSKALEYYEKYTKYSAEFQKTAKLEEIQKMEMLFEYKQRAVADSIKNVVENGYKDEILRSNTEQMRKDYLLKIALTIGLIFFLIFAVLIFNRFRITSRQKLIIEEKNKQTEEQKAIIEEKQKEILDSINYAKRIQDSLLDNFEAVSKFFSDSCLFLKPKDIVSGDFYWINKKTITENTSPGKSTVRELFYLAVCDSTGHGVPGGFMSLLNIAYLSEAINEKDIHLPNKVFEHVRMRLINTISKNDQKDGFDGVLLCFEKKFHFENKQQISSDIHFSYAAAHNSPVVIRNKQLIELKTDKMPVGYGERNEPFKLYDFDIKEGDIVYLYTDGYADQFGGEKGKKFKYKQLNELLTSISDQKLSDQADALHKVFEKWKGNNEQVDDVCFVGIKI